MLFVLNKLTVKLDYSEWYVNSSFPRWYPNLMQTIFLLSYTPCVIAKRRSPRMPLSSNEQVKPNFCMCCGCVIIIWERNSLLAIPATTIHVVLSDCWIVTGTLLLSLHSHALTLFTGCLETGHYASFHPSSRWLFLSSVLLNEESASRPASMNTRICVSWATTTAIHIYI